MKNFITIEGCDGVGKTFQTNLLKQYCAQNGYDVVFTREPGGSEIAEKIRNIILDVKNQGMDDLCEAFLYASARIQHLKDIVKPALEQCKVVFCDRFIHSSYAYQGFGRGIDLDTIVHLNELAIGQYTPQYVIFLDLSPEDAFKRKGGQDKNDRMENVDFSFHQRVYAGYKHFAQSNPDTFICIDASGTVEETHNKIVSALKQKGIL